jgi:hypothetical protein
VSARPAPGILAPWLCRRCKRALWWRKTRVDLVPVLVDVDNQRRCRPLSRFGGHTHAMPRVERKPR